MNRDLNELEKRCGYTFQDKNLFHRALTHSSYANEHKKYKAVCNERLEFLGGAVLEVVSSDFLYHKYPEKPEGELSKIRASLVCEPTLAYCAADLELGSVVAGQGACTNSSFADQYELGGSFAPICDFDLLMAAVDSAKELGVKMPVGNLYSSDTFYDAALRNMRYAKMGVMAVEMEAAGLYCTAAYTGKRALAICSISDNLITGEELSADERQTTFTNMMKIALEAAVKMAAKK